MGTKSFLYPGGREAGVDESLAKAARTARDVLSRDEFEINAAPVSIPCVVDNSPGDTSYNRLPHGILWTVDELGTAEEMLKTLKVYGPADEVFNILRNDDTSTEREEPCTSPK